MTDPANHDLAPETVNDEQEDEATQAQDVASQALGRESTGLGLSDSEKAPAGIDDEAADVPDLVDHMRQMTTSGRVDMSAYLGERNDDDEEGMLGPTGEED